MLICKPVITDDAISVTVCSTLLIRNICACMYLCARRVSKGNSVNENWKKNIFCPFVFIFSAVLPRRTAYYFDFRFGIFEVLNEDSTLCTEKASASTKKGSAKMTRPNQSKTN